MYKILVTNDDGIHAHGLRTLVYYLKDIATVYVVAPAEQQSAKSRTLTFSHPMKAEEHEVEGAEVAYAIDGSPADCVKWAMKTFEELVGFDYIISGINQGENTGQAPFYSGTVAAALEGANYGVRSIALSVNTHEASHFGYICSMIPELLEMSAQQDQDVVLNVNAPNIPPEMVKGVRITELAPKGRCPYYEFIDTEDGTQQMAYFFPDFQPDLREDYSCITLNYVSITPIRASLTSHVALKKMRGMSVDESLCIFMGVQESVVPAMWKASRFESNIKTWAKCVSRLDMPTLMVEQYGDGKTIKAVSSAVSNTEYVNTNAFNGFECRKFEELTETLNYRRVYLAGLQTHISIEQTAREFRRRGYDVVVVEDCCSSRAKANHNLAIEGMRADGCRILTMEAAAMEIMGGSSHPAYKTVSEILISERQ